MLNNKPKTKTFEFLTLFTMVIGTVIGSGIYMKNNELLQQTQNPIISIALWALVGFVCVISVRIFIEISSSTKHFGNGTIGNWTKLFINRKVASLFSIFYLVMYLPSTQAFFIGTFIMYFFQAIGVVIQPSTQISIYLAAGIFVLVGFTLLQMYKPKYNKTLQVFGTIFKFIPLVIALVAGFVLMDKTGGSSAMWNGGGETGGHWSTTSISKTAFIGGFGAILFSFDGYIYIANAQKDATHKDVVPKALFFGMIFVAIFYILMAISLFLGSPDGSIQKLFEKLLSGGAKTPTELVANLSRVISNSILIIICALNINVFTYIGAVDVQSDAEMGLLFSGKQKTTMTEKQAGWTQMAIVAMIYVIMVLLGFFIPIATAGWEGINTIITMEGIKTGIFYAPLTLMGEFASAVSALSFLLISAIVFAAISNRKTNKVKVDKVRFFLPLAIFSSVAMCLFTFFGIFTFVFPNEFLLDDKKWIETSGFIFTIMLVLSLILWIAVFLIQEKLLFKKYPNQMIIQELRQ
ncbi:APC family permease [Williamsoniiplasma lucivorax]|uniref:Amino acid permease n=1 Tax=Williamsoniiplasma lucivorax TaxID=209274 RepID=A0A2S5RFU4_9MOLU|nr:APC family permease [Williamsoniiplasma lucivorax]PPE06005.1 amino acid permease [Williamsoniiplasma lucivorax]